jgi:ABC-2 type transport system ATP-binding protein
MLGGNGYLLLVMGIGVLARVAFGVVRSRGRRGPSDVEHAHQGERRPGALGRTLEPPGRDGRPSPRRPGRERDGIASPAVVVEDLTKRYGTFAAVDAVSFDVAAGMVVALLGPNGAGKTTTVEILEGFLAPTGGRVRVLGQDPRHGDRAWRARIGLVLQSTALDAQLTVAEVLSAFARLYPHPWPLPELLELVDLSGEASTRIGTLSGGQRRRVDVALGIVGRPELLFLDEPTTGFDPAARREAWSAIENLTAVGTTIVLTTHYLEEAHHLADRVIVLAEGRVVADATPQELRARAGGSTIRYRLPARARPEDIPAVLAGSFDPGHRALVVRSGDVPGALEALIGWARDRRLDLAGLEVGPPSLEDAYLALTTGPELPACEGVAP